MVTVRMTQLSRFLTLGSYDWRALAPLGKLDARCSPLSHPLRPQTVAVSIRVL
jgi:hypothetical protein